MDEMPTIAMFDDAPIDKPAEPVKRGPGRPKKAAPADKAPAKAPADKAPTERPGSSPGRPSNRAKRAQALEGLYTMAGGALLMVSPTIGASVLKQAHDCAEALATLGETNRRVGKALDALLTSGGTGAVLIAHLPILLATYRVVTAGEPAGTDDGSPLDLLAAMMGAVS